ncbi:hypothetical protein ACF3DV_08360 [Chlorogloeopsis fritschii PCC 9212]|uniref:Uncharacterized protein n=1 Tax=Chlorogloeopsis fritschii PCC 6912 TaxID=211165 RepID=A0A3S1AA41_CHLFR|nr:hypothetical protein [Chlorogloeopsis fritschii]RUR73612.1 hypothetical protein PCC6912_56100 [Chlorogloeopsis fritschii PCC 6912]
MKIFFLPLTRLTVATFASLGFASLLVPQPSLAQLTNQYDQTTYDPQNTDFCSGNSQDSSFNVFNLIHCANLRGRSWDSTEQNSDINDVARDFKERQKLRFQQQQQGQPQTQPSTSLPVITLPSATPQPNQ